MKALLYLMLGINLAYFGLHLDSFRQYVVSEEQLKAQHQIVLLSELKTLPALRPVDSYKPVQFERLSSLSSWLDDSILTSEQGLSGLS